jgi:iron complex outermembrane recepter protein
MKHANGSFERTSGAGRRGLAMAVAAALAGAAPGAVYAQAAPAATAAPATGPERGVMQEIVVTATRHEEALSKVPISVTALSQETMDQKGIKDFQDIVRFTPGVSIDNSGTNAISIRGISSSGGAGTTGIYLDDTPIQMRSVGFNPDDTLPKTFDLERVEVLRGPQGTLFGAGSEGGTVRYILAQPKVIGESTYSRSELSFTHYGEPSYEAGVAHGDTLIDDTLGYRASIWYREDGGWINRVDPTTGAETEHGINHAGTLMARLAALWRPSERVSITPSIIYQDIKQHDQDTYWPAYSNPAEGVFNTATPERMPKPDRWYLPALKVEIDLGKSTFFSNSSFYHRDQQDAYQGTVYDLAFYQSLGWPASGYGLSCTAAQTAPPCPWYPLLDNNGIHLPPGWGNYQTPNLMTNQQRTWTQEFRWQSNDDTSKLRWTVGAFWQLAEELSVEELIDPNVNAFWQTLYGVNATDIFIDNSGIAHYYCNGVGTPGLGFPSCDIYYNRNRTGDRQAAIFGELTYAFTDVWKLTLGDRYARTQFTLDHYSDGLENFISSHLPASEKESPSTPKLSLAAQVDPKNLYYATYAKGFRVGGGNAPLPGYCDPSLIAAGYPTPPGAPLTYKSDSTDNYEIGSKNAIGSAFKIATSVYYIKWKDIQQSVYVAGLCGLQFTDNLGTAVAKGFDLQAELAAGPFDFEVALGYTSARYTADSPHGLAFAGDAISGQAAIDYAPGVNPPWTGAFGAQYNFSLQGHDAFMRVDYTYASRNNWPSALQDPGSAANPSAQFNAATYTLSSSSFVSARGGITIGDWQYALFADNLLDSHTVTNYALGQADPFNPNPPGVQQNQYTYRPRTVGISLTYRSH